MPHFSNWGSSLDICFSHLLSVQERVKESIQFYCRSQHHQHAVRLAQQHEMYPDMMTAALESNQRFVQLNAAKYVFCDRSLYVYILYASMTMRMSTFLQLLLMQDF
jgi:ribosomal protein L16 Arg81 hydroxylase